MPDALQLELLACPIPRTPIAAELYAHFAEGGSIADALKLAERLERVIGTRRASAPAAAGTRGTRLTHDWSPSEADLSFAVQRGMPEGLVSTEIEKFRNYWTAKSGASATKRDWSATWRNWIINSLERGNGPASNRGPSPGTNLSSRHTATGSDAILAGMGRLAHRIDQRRMSAVAERREMADDTHPSFAFDVNPTRARRD